MTVVSGSSANAVRFTPGGAKTNVPVGAATRSPSSSNVARPCRTRYSSSSASGSDSSCSLMMRSPTSRAVQALTPKDVMPKWCRTGRNGSRPSVTSSISSSRATAYFVIGVLPRRTSRTAAILTRASLASEAAAATAEVWHLGGRRSPKPVEALGLEQAVTPASAFKTEKPAFDACSDRRASAAEAGGEDDKLVRRQQRNSVGVGHAPRPVALEQRDGPRVLSAVTRLVLDDAPPERHGSDHVALVMRTAAPGGAR